MNPETVFQTWVPAEGVWSLWARPILFAQMQQRDYRRHASTPFKDPDDEALQHAIIPEGTPAPRTDAWRNIDVSWASQAGEGVLFVVDLSGAESAWMGLALAGAGYRPVPLYNACCGANEVIDQGPIMVALLVGTAYLASLPLPDDAPPVFLLDANRMKPNRPLLPLAFDNRWKVFPQDFPSAAFLVTKGITRAMLVLRNERQPAEDLAHILRRWQEAGIGIEVKNVADDLAPMPIRVDQPPWYRSVWQRVQALIGLRRSWWGGFGSEIPEPSKSHG